MLNNITKVSTMEKKNSNQQNPNQAEILKLESQIARYEDKQKRRNKRIESLQKQIVTRKNQLDQYEKESDKISQKAELENQRDEEKFQKLLNRKTAQLERMQDSYKKLFARIEKYQQGLNDWKELKEDSLKTRKEKRLNYFSKNSKETLSQKIESKELYLAVLEERNKKHTRLIESKMKKIEKLKSDTPQNKLKLVKQTEDIKTEVVKNPAVEKQSSTPKTNIKPTNQK